MWMSSLSTLLYCMYSTDTLDKGMVHVLGGTEQAGVKFHYTTQNDTNSKIKECLFLEFSM